MIIPAPGNTTAPGGTFQDAHGRSLVIGPFATKPESSACGTSGGVQNELSPQDPTLTLPACTGPGMRTEFDWESADGPTGVTYGQDNETSTSFSLTATITSGNSVFVEQAQMPEDWTRNSSTVATFTAIFTDPGDCLEDVTVLTPYASDNSCASAGSLVLPVPTTGGYRWTGANDGAGAGAYNVTAVADDGYTLIGEDEHTVVVKAAGAGRTCPGGDGNPKPPIEAPDEAELVSPRYASSTAANCSRDGRLVVPTQPAGVLVGRAGTAPGEVTFTYSPAAGYVFPAGTDTEVTVTVAAQLTGDDCIQGVETSKPKPTVNPGTKSPVKGAPAVAPVNAGNDAEVLGEQAVAVPTAVAAGLGDTMTAAPTTGSPQLAQALVAAGLLMLVAGGATGLGRRTRGAHES